jgi:hypothetical protein
VAHVTSVHTLTGVNQELGERSPATVTANHEFVGKPVQL